MYWQSVFQKRLPLSSLEKQHVHHMVIINRIWSLTLSLKLNRTLNPNGYFVINWYKYICKYVNQRSQRTYDINSAVTKGRWGAYHHMAMKYLHNVFQAIIVTCILYALAAWGCFLSKELSGRIDACLKRCYHYGFSSCKDWMCWHFVWYSLYGIVSQNVLFWSLSAWHFALR